MVPARSIKLNKPAQLNSERAIKTKRKEDALALAELIYDMYKDEQQRENDIMKDGQNNAQTTKTN